MEHGSTSWLLTLPFLSHDAHYEHVNGAVIVFLAILTVSILAHLAIKGKEDTLIVPPRKFGLVSLVDLIVGGLHKMVVDVVGYHGERYIYFIGACFVFILFSNLLGLLPMSSSPSSNVNTTFALGISAFIYYNFVGIQAHGLKNYGKHFLMGLGIFGLPIALVEMISHFIRPASLGLRLAVNLHIDHQLVGSFQQLCAWVVPVPLMLFGIIVCVIQAFLFSILTTVYVAMATEH